MNVSFISVQGKSTKILFTFVFSLSSESRHLFEIRIYINHEICDKSSPIFDPGQAQVMQGYMWCQIQYLEVAQTSRKHTHKQITLTRTEQAPKHTFKYRHTNTHRLEFCTLSAEKCVRSNLGNCTVSVSSRVKLMDEKHPIFEERLPP